ncbi:lipopolysaccharide assembly LapA domain-containing protein [Chryseomicrobium palamuruense]|uniref:Lipopolysaccharide assembly LapA domain-containing protein n=1 Tax=Chryseomicrobium palamuruense TaxID=682973 RepID=A0ABV8UZS0_9BACL
MKAQWIILIGLILAIVIAIFAVVNVDAVPVNYLFGEAEWPLILVILGSALLGALVSGLLAMVRSFTLSRKVKALEAEKTKRDAELHAVENELAVYREREMKSQPTYQQEITPSN